MKIYIATGSPDMYTPEMKYLKTYVPDQFTSESDIVMYYLREVGKNRCAARVVSFDIDTHEVVVLGEKSVEPKKKIVINKSTSPKSNVKATTMSIGQMLQATQAVLINQQDVLGDLSISTVPTYINGVAIHHDQ